MGRNSRRTNKTESAATPTFKNVGYGALEFLPLFPRSEKSGDFWRHLLGMFYTRQGHARRSPLGTAPEITSVVTTDTYSTREYAKRRWMGEIDEKAADVAVKPSRTATFEVVNQIHLEHEKQFKTVIDTDANFGSVTDLSLTPTSQFDDYDNSDPRALIGALRLALLPYIPFNLGSILPQLKLGMSPAIAEVLLEHPKFLARYANTDGNLSYSQLADYLRVGQIVILEAYENTKDPNAVDALTDPTLEPIIGDDVMILALVDESREWGSLTWGKTPYWQIPETAGFAEFDPDGLPIRMRDYEAPEKGGGGTWREGDAWWGTKIVFEFLAAKIENPIAG